ncbi:peptidylprolyl isomerase [Allofustis seminis]|uniref:peptidylprolyl isomerase n=1 Tax=Allofustis seminis TaxID=166939 RepID=UPI00037AB7A5|nr:peptidylprolyl isomerase [Allofustis seminis]
MNFPQLNEDLKPTLTICTTLGDISIALFEEQAPKAVENFMTLAKKGYYDGVIFHRVIPDFMIQGGDPTGTGRGGESIWGQAFEDEFSRELFNLKGALSMANAGPHTNGSQFFIVTAPFVPVDMLQQMEAAGYPEEIVKAYAENGGTPWLDFKHTVFGQVTSGLDVAERIQNVERDFADKPVESIIIEKIIQHES